MTTSYDNDECAMRIACDTADCASEDTADGSFHECIASFKQGGWRTFKADGEWKNSCPKCFDAWKISQKPQESDTIVYPD